MLSYRRETVLQRALVLAKVEVWTVTGRLFYGYYRSVFNHCDIIGQQSNRIQWKTQNKNVRCSSSVHWKARSGLPIVLIELFFARLQLRRYEQKYMENRRFRSNASNLTRAGSWSLRALRLKRLRAPRTYICNIELISERDVVSSRSRSLYVIVRPSICLSVVCL